MFAFKTHLRFTTFAVLPHACFKRKTQVTDELKSSDVFRPSQQFYENV